MAEIVQQRIEDRIPELEQLERVGLFTKKEIKSILKRSTALEYKLHRLIISKDDFIAYIQYEINVLELIKKRRACIGYQFKKEEIEFHIIQRINNVFRRATKKWKDDVQLWLSQIAFCKSWAMKHQLSKTFSAMLAIHPDKPALWIMAAKTEMEDRDSPENARQLFLRALRFHPENKKLYQEYFRMELLNAEKLQIQKKELEKAKMDLDEMMVPSELLNGKLAEVVYRNATETIPGAEFMVSLLNIATIFDFAKELQDKIFQDLQTKYTDDCLTWEIMARKHLEAPGAGKELQSTKMKACDIIQREERCCQVYEDGIKSLGTEPMWNCYVSFCLERFERKTTASQLKEKRLERLLSVLQQAHDSSMLKEDFYRKWLQVLLSTDDEEGAARVAVAATQKFSQSVKMWSLSLQTLMEVGSEDVRKLFQEALTHISPKESLPVWQLQVQWSVTSQSPEETEALFQRGLMSSVAAVSMEMKENYLDWSYKTGGYKKARKTFISLHENRPFSNGFFTKMIQIEKEQESPKMSLLRDYYERAVREFGSTDDDLWLSYIQEELGPHGQPENCSKIHWRAMKLLEGESVERFTSKHTLMQTGHI